MKRLLLLLVLIVSINTYAQITFEKGYFIDDYNNKIECLIKNKDWRSNPTIVEYKVSENEETKSFDITQVKEFEIYNVSKYISVNVDIDRSSENINKLSINKEPIFLKEKLFLKVLIDGKASLYSYIDSNLKRYFYTTSESNVIQQLVYKSYKNESGYIKKNNSFKKQLWDNLKCESFTQEEFKKLDYNKSDLTNLFEEYNRCYNYNFKSYKKKKTDSFNLSIRPRIANYNIKFEDDLDLGSKIGFGLGVEVEFILPFNKNKWGILLEPTYQKVSIESNNNNSFDLIINESTAKVDYNSIELSIGARHYFFINDTSKIFLDISYTQDLALKSNYNYSFRKLFASGYEISNGEYSREFKSKYGGVGFGLGYKYNKYSIQFRFQPSKIIMQDDIYGVLTNKSMSLIFGYTLF